MYPFILIHEFGHALCISEISKRHSIEHKPVIVIGNYENCLGEKPNHKIFGFDVYHYDNFSCKTGITLYPYFDKFSNDEIMKCARAGYRMELILSLISFVFTALFSILTYVYSSQFFLVFAALCFIICGTELILATTTISKSPDKSIWSNPKTFNTVTIAEQYYDLRSFSS